MLACHKTLVQRASLYYRNTYAIQKFNGNHDYMKSVWKYSTIAWPRSKEMSEMNEVEFQQYIPKMVNLMVKQCYDEFLEKNPKMAPLNTLRIHPALAEVTIAVPMKFDEELFDCLKAYCDYHGMIIKRTEDTLDKLDRKGVPLFMLTENDARDTGIIKVRSRDTGFFYEVHILRMKKLLAQFAVEHGPFRHYTEARWNAEKDTAKSIPDVLDKNDTFGAVPQLSASLFPKQLYNDLLDNLDVEPTDEPQVVTPKVTKTSKSVATKPLRDTVPKKVRSTKQATSDGPSLAAQLLAANSGQGVKIQETPSEELGASKATSLDLLEDDDEDDDFGAMFSDKN